MMQTWSPGRVSSFGAAFARSAAWNGAPAVKRRARPVRALAGPGLEAQAGAGVRDRAVRVGESILDALPQVFQDFLRHQSMAVIGAADAAGRVWASLLTGPPGFLHAVSDQAVHLDAAPAPGDPLAD